jgi:hypothetical protein
MRKSIIFTLLLNITQPTMLLPLCYVALIECALVHDMISYLALLGPRITIPSFNHIHL